MMQRNDTLGDWLEQRARCSPAQPGLVYKQSCWDFRAMHQEVDLLANRLAGEGVHSGEHVAALLPNCPEAVFLVHALARLGAILVPLNLRLSPTELTWTMVQADCAFLVHNAQTLSIVDPLNPATQTETSRPIRINLNELTNHRFAKNARKNEGTAYALQDHLRDDVQAAPDSQELERIQAIIFTSGTTGKPKGAQLTFGNHFYSAISSAFRLGVDPKDRWLATLPLFHVGGLAILFRSCLYGTTLVLQDGFDPQAVLNAISDHNISLVSLVPTMLHRLLELPGSVPIMKRLRAILLGGAAAPRPLLERALAAGLNLALTYGMTETATQIATASPAETRRKPGSVGKPLLFCRLRILDETGHSLPESQVGQIAVSGPVVMAGYYRQPGQSGESEPSQELLTGDLGYVDGDGDLWVLQRRSDLIISGGENVYPAEVEAVLLSHPRVEAACVVGIEHPEWGQQVAAAVVAQPDADLTDTEVIAFCRQNLAAYKIPRRLVFLEKLPQTETGKVIRSRVIEMMDRNPEE